MKRIVIDIFHVTESNEVKEPEEIFTTWHAIW